MELQQRLDGLMAERDDYRCKDRTDIKDKRVIALLGPSAVGKSTLINACLERADRWGMDSAAEAGSTGTRDERPDDPANYHMGLPQEMAVGLIELGAPTNWSSSPTGEIYLTLPRDFEAQYNFMACLPDSLPMLRRAGFAAVHALYVVTAVDAWEEQLASRLWTPETSELPVKERVYKRDALGRVTEAVESLEYAMKPGSNPMIRISNTPGEESLRTTADIIVKTIMNHHGQGASIMQMQQEYDKNLREMYSRALDIHWEIEQATAS